MPLKKSLYSEMSTVHAFGVKRVNTVQKVHAFGVKRIHIWCKKYTPLVLRGFTTDASWNFLNFIINALIFLVSKLKSLT